MMDAVFLDSGGPLDAHPALTARLFQRPAFRFQADIGPDPPRLVQPPPPDWSLGFPGFAKLGAKSWRDGGRLRIIPELIPFVPAIAGLLAELSTNQRRYLELVRPYHSRLDLAVFRYVDFSDISEVRWVWRDGRARLSSGCYRGLSAERAHRAADEMRGLIEKVSLFLPSRVVVDLAIGPEGNISILELNPLGSPTAGRDPGRSAIPSAPATLPAI
jgi:hypothetical protein